MLAARNSNSQHHELEAGLGIVACAGPGPGSNTVNTKLKFAEKSYNVLLRNMAVGLDTMTDENAHVS